MLILVAPDSYKGSLRAVEAAKAMARGVALAKPGAKIDLAPMADGGEGALETVLAATKGEKIEVEVHDPLGGTVKAFYGLVQGEKRQAFVEMAQASGLCLVHEKERNPLQSSTFGTGELIAHALDSGVEELIVAIGGSATNDAGAGMAQALGFSLLNEGGEEISSGGGALLELSRIDGSKCHPSITDCTVLAACDVDNPLCGPNGASFVYGPQKGASQEDVEILDRALCNFAGVVERDLGEKILNLPGAGAAGGLGGGLVAFLGACIEPGFDTIASLCNLEERISRADLVITGEGCLDGQALHGKTPYGVIKLAVKQGVPVIAVAGSLGKGYEGLFDLGLKSVFSLERDDIDKDRAMKQAFELLVQTTANAVERFLR